MELGTGISLSLAWMIEGLDEDSWWTSINNDADLINIAKDFFSKDPRLNLVCMDGTEWIKN